MRKFQVVAVVEDLLVRIAKAKSVGEAKDQVVDLLGRLAKYGGKEDLSVFGIDFDKVEEANKAKAKAKAQAKADKSASAPAKASVPVGNAELFSQFMAFMQQAQAQPVSSSKKKK